MPLKDRYISSLVAHQLSIIPTTRPTLPSTTGISATDTSTGSKHHGALSLQLSTYDCLTVRSQREPRASIRHAQCSAATVTIFEGAIHANVATLVLLMTTRWFVLSNHRWISPQSQDKTRPDSPLIF